MKQRKAEIAASVVDICSVEEVRLDVDAAVVPPIKKSWEPVEYKIFVMYMPPTGEACRPELAFVASVRGDVDAVELPSDGEDGRGPQSEDHAGGKKEEPAARQETQENEEGPWDS
jgi:hypothetical protein